MSVPGPYTHRVAVSAYVIKDDAFLLMRRATPPVIWAPPGGRLRPDENPRDGVIREILEECGLTVQLIGISDVWHGDFGRGIFVSVDFVARYVSGEPALSVEHSEYRWSTLEEIKKGQPETGGARTGYRAEDFEKAWRYFVRFAM